ncbi:MULTISPECIES: dethiobiotin synthase [Clostridia]|jgi:dethiobiotin synthase (EC 6.3.3.3)|uniref:dethiobiotin synthase n=1 Tax=Clostridia TaxID=186801 RepID=UPI000481D774|nr:MULTISPECIES: dethiobiotin synthase [Clostridia]MBM7687279.1 dethiobiotin synthetase [Defluviitalea raffinosedens]
MTKGIFITATGTDIGKTYVAALMIKKLRSSGRNAGYYKAALSGASSVENSDAGYVNRVANIGQEEETLFSYLYSNAVSPHLAAKLEGNPAEISKIITDYTKVRELYDYVTVEGSGGIICPIRYDDTTHILLEDIVKALGLNTLIIADAGLGTINAVTLTAEYLRSRGIGIKGVILNRYTGGIMQDDNITMIEKIAKIPVLSLVKPYADEIEMSADEIEALYE